MTSFINKLRRTLADILPAWKGLRAIRPVPERFKETPVIPLPVRRSGADFSDAA